jgi:predicted nucleic acid-binding protein
VTATPPYRSAQEHLDDLVGLVWSMVERQVLAHGERGLLPRYADPGLGVDAEAEAATAVQRIAELDATIIGDGARIVARLAAARAAGAPLPWDVARARLALTATEERTLIILLALEVDPQLRQRARLLADPGSGSHADVVMIASLVYAAPEVRERLIEELAPDARLFRYRLIEHVAGARSLEDTAFVLRTLRLNRRMIELAHGVLRLDPEVARAAQLIDVPPGHDALVLDDGLKREVTELLRAADAAGAAGRTAPVVLLTGPDGSGRKSLVFGAARALGRAVLLVRCAELARDPAAMAHQTQALMREALLSGAIPLLDGVDALAADLERGLPDRARALDEAILVALPGAVAATSPRGEARPVRFARGLVIIELSVPSETARTTLWHRALGEPELAAHAAARYPITGGLIAKAARTVHARIASRAGDERRAGVDDVHAGVRASLEDKIAGLGTRILWRQRWDDLVLPAESLEEIHEMIARVKHKRTVYEDWGFARKVAKGLGISALFSGPPGTGKTMAAGIIADELALDLYQIDLSRIVSKWVGETEKNLAALFEAAEAGHAILLFDEADSLFAKRTQVKSSVDRYANLEVNYLLQRMESFNGITILTTNLDSVIDDAFRRRISFRIEFPLPEADERALLWRALLPSEASVGDDIDWAALARRFEMSGGYIKNAVLRAAFLAAEDGEPIAMRHLVRGASLEYSGMGKVVAQFPTAPPGRR